MTEPSTAAPGFDAPGAAKQKNPTAERGSGAPADPAHLGRAAQHLSPDEVRTYAPAMLVAAAAFETGEEVQHLLAGRLLGHSGVVIETDRRILAVNGRGWNPDLAALAVGPDLRVTSWLRNDWAAVELDDGVQRLVIDQITDPASVTIFAAAIRGRTSDSPLDPR